MSLAITLRDCQAEAFRRLAAGVADRKAAFHTPTLVTLAPDGTPEARTMVLRGFDPAKHECRLHTDARSGKVAGLAREPRCALHVYDAAAKMQLRLRCVASLHADDAIADAGWADSRDTSRMVYGAEDAPGIAVQQPPAAARDAAGGRRHFRVILLRFDQLEWLELAAAGHRRARFSWRSGEVPEATWLAP